jgi:putative membrane protein
MHVSFRFRTGAAILGLAAAAFLGGCGNSENTPSSENAPKTPDRSTTATAADNSPDNFLKKAAMGDITEVRLGEMAKSRASSPEVKQFAQQMIDDHSKHLDQVKQVAAKKNVTLPSTMDPQEQGDVDKLEKMTGSEFDLAYVKNMVEDHTRDVSEYEQQAKAQQDSDVKSLAEQTLPALRHHLQMARDMNDKLSKPGSQASGEKPSEQPIQTKRESEPQPAR